MKVALSTRDAWEGRPNYYVVRLRHGCPLLVKAVAHIAYLTPLRISTVDQDVRAIESQNANWTNVQSLNQARRFSSFLSLRFSLNAFNSALLNF